MENKGRQKIKKRLLEAPKCAHPLSVRSNFSLEVSLCSNIQVFSDDNLHRLRQQEGLGRVSQLMIHVDNKLTQNRICKIIMSTILKNNLQIQGHETCISKSECGQSLIGQFMEIRS